MILALGMLVGLSITGTLADDVPRAADRDDPLELGTVEKSTVRLVLLDVVVVDKTVPFADFREHRALFWMLRHLKIVTPDGVPYDSEQHYVGAFPGPEPGDPPRETTSLTAERASAADVVYIADTYGVYEGDLESGAKMQAALERMPTR